MFDVDPCGDIGGDTEGGAADPCGGLVDGGGCCMGGVP